MANNSASAGPTLPLAVLAAQAPISMAAVSVVKLAMVREAAKLTPDPRHVVTPLDSN